MDLRIEKESRSVNDRMLKDVMELGGDIIYSERFAAAQKVPHHNKKRGNIAAHCLETACYALLLSRWLEQRGQSVSTVDAVRAGLLHDLGMTEQDVFLSPSRVKAYTHPREGARIAREEFGANEVQVDAILHHMWPFCCLTPPHSTEGWIVTVADKCCSLNELRRFLRRGKAPTW